LFLEGHPRLPNDNWESKVSLYCLYTGLFAGNRHLLFSVLKFANIVQSRSPARNLYKLVEFLRVF